MSFARDRYTASAAQTDFTITFAYQDEADVLVYKDGVLMGFDTDADVTSYQIVTSTIVRFGAGLAGAEEIELLRSTSQSAREVDWTAPSTMAEEDLDNDSIQAFYMAQEALDQAAIKLGQNSDDEWSAAIATVDTKIHDVADPTSAQDACTKAYADAISAAAGNVPTPDNPGHDNFILSAASGSFAWEAMVAADIPNDLLDSQHYAAGSIDLEHMSANSVDSDQYVDASVDGVHLSLDAKVGVRTSFDLTNGGADDLTAAAILTGLSGAEEIEISIELVSTDAANQGLLLQLGDAGGIEATGYVGGSVSLQDATQAVDNATTGFLLSDETAQDAATVSTFAIRLVHMGSNKWKMTSLGGATGEMFAGMGTKTLTAALDRVTLTTTGGTAALDGGDSYHAVR